MERKLRIQLTVSVLVALFALLSIILVITSVVRIAAANDTADSYLEVILDHNGELPQAPSEYASEDLAEGVQETRFFIVWLDKDGSVQRYDLDSISSVDRDQADELAKQAMSEHSDSGEVGDFRYLRRKDKGGSTEIGFLDRSRAHHDMSSAIVSLALVMECGVAIVTVIFALLSKRIVAPIVNSQESQRQFVIDAGHDLRTPVSIISADADVLAMDIGEDNEWLRDIKRQVGVMSDLTESLIVLSRAATADERKNGGPVSMSAVVGDRVTGFQSRSLLENHELKVHIAPDVMVRGNDQYLSRMTGALIDNAFKYSTAGSAIEVGLDSTRRSAKLTVSNSAEGVDPSEVDRWFDRFYQADRSRQHKAGGYGIGLSMVRAVAESHGGKAEASADSDAGTVTFSVTLPLLKMKDDDKGGRNGRDDRS